MRSPHPFSPQISKLLPPAKHPSSHAATPPPSTGDSQSLSPHRHGLPPTATASPSPHDHGCGPHVVQVPQPTPPLSILHCPHRARDGRISYTPLTSFAENPYSPHNATHFPLTHDICRKPLVSLIQV